MQTADKTGVAALVAGLSATVIGVAVPLAFPTLSAPFWKGVVIIGAVVLVLAMIYLVYLHFDWRKRLAPLFLMIVGGLMFFFGASWYGLTFTQLKSLSKPSPNTSKNSPEANNVNLVFECHLADLPTKVPPEGHIYTLPLFYSPESGVLRSMTQSTIHGQPGSDLAWFSDLKFPQVYRCEITNYEIAPLLQVAMTFKIEYRELLAADANPSVTKSGNLIHNYEWPVLFPKIDPGKSNTAIIYVYNQSNYFAYVAPPDIASYMMLGENTRREGALLPIGMLAGMSLWPAERTK